MYVIRTWDLPTRLFHWALVLCVTGLFITGNMGGDAMRWHFFLGYTVLTLLLFRFFWGWLGGYWSRFAHFPLSPRSVVAYLSGRWPETHLGHNPLGSYSVLLMLLALAVQAVAGLISDDEIATHGPLSILVSGDWVSLATSWHTQIGKFLVLGLIGLHVAAIVVYKVSKGLSLVPPMIHGDKTLNLPTVSSADGWRERLWALAMLIWSISLVWVLVHMAD